MSHEQAQAQTEDLAKTNLVALANAVELGKQVIQEIAGDEIAATIDGQSVSGSLVCDLLAAKLNVKLNTQPMGV